MKGREEQKSHFQNSAGEDMNIDGQNENGEDTEKENGMDNNGLAVSGEASEFNHTRISGQLEKQARREENEEKVPVETWIDFKISTAVALSLC
ncbi:hypothetical protein Csa_014303 [Cucumis sativus]|nr:hypothetical protein Csa_014303 [Cucumis sativus]